ncbi:MAG: hypothetical protein EXS05_24275 [Planctomycetaceae bacterium]|nr:hypothetical protein [Planctomycetaceae bacterium]
MFRHFRSLLVAGGLLIVALSWLTVVPSKAKDETDPVQKTETKVKPGIKKLAIKAFMHKKLASSQEILEGLAMEDFDLIEKGAKQLKVMSLAAEFMVVDDPLYPHHADQFRRTVAKIEKAAEEQRLDGATLGFVEMTMSCVECHKFVRTIMIAK